MIFKLALILSSAATICAAPTSGAAIQSRDLNEIQSKHASDIMARVKAEGVGSQGCVAAITTALTESELRMFANTAVPASMGMPHDDVGGDKDSVGLFQHRATYYTDINCSMNAACSTGIFIKDMKAVPGWETMGVAALCQAVQRSEIPDAYNKKVEQAKNICNAEGGF